MFRRVLALMIVLLTILMHSLPMNASTELETAQERISSRDLPEKLISVLSHIADFAITSSQEEDFRQYAFLTDDLNAFEKYAYTSQHPIAENSSGQTYLRLELLVLIYETASAAKAASDDLFASADPDIGLSYAWDYVMNVDTIMYWIHAPCLFSDHHWRNVVSQLQGHLGLETSESGECFECRCGLNCRQRWEE